MAERRMFAKTIVTSDAFLDMPMSARCLYFTLAMLADDEGFVNNPKSIMRQVGATQDDMQILIAKKFIIVFDSGVIVIKHWRLHNYIQSDRFNPTKYVEERKQLFVNDKKAYSMKGEAETVEISTMYPERIQNVSETDTQVRLGKDRLDKDKDIKSKYGVFDNVMLKTQELEKLKERFPKDWEDRIDSLSEYMRSKGKQYKDHYATILSWARKEERDNKDKPKPVEPKKYKVFEKEDYEKDDFKAEEMPEATKELRKKLGGMFNAG